MPSKAKVTKEEIAAASRALALKEFEAYTADFPDFSPAFKRIGMQMVSYAIHEPKLFKLLFMQAYPQRQSFDSVPVFSAPPVKDGAEKEKNK